MITKQYTADRNEIAGDPKSKIPAEMANYWINGVNSLISDLQPVKDAGGFLALIDINTFRVRATTVLNTSYPQLIPIQKTAGNLVIASDIITLQKGFLYQMLLGLYGNGAGYSVITIHDGSNNDILPQSSVVIGASSTAGLNSCVGVGVYDMTEAVSDLNIKVVNIGFAGAFTLTANYGGLVINKYKKIPFSALT